MPFTYSLEHEDGSPTEPATVLDSRAELEPGRHHPARRQPDYTWSRSGRVRSRTTIPSWSLKLPNPATSPFIRKATRQGDISRYRPQAARK